MYIIHINIYLLYYRNISSKMNGSIILSEPLRSLEDCTPFRDVLFQAHLPNNLKGCHFWVQLKAVKVILMGFGLRVKLHGPYGLWRWWFFKSTYWIGMLYRAIGVPLRGNHGTGFESILQQCYLLLSMLPSYGIAVSDLYGLRKDLKLSIFYLPCDLRSPYPDDPWSTKT